MSMAAKIMCCGHKPVLIDIVTVQSVFIYSGLLCHVACMYVCMCVFVCVYVGHQSNAAVAAPPAGVAAVAGPAGYLRNSQVDTMA